MGASYQWSPTQVRSGFFARRGVPLVFCVVSAIAFMALAPDTLNALHHRWTELNGTYSHGYLWVPVCLGLVIHRLMTGQFQTSPSLVGVMAVLMCAALWLAGSIIQLGLLQQLVLPALMGGLILTGFGWAALGATLVPLLGLYLAIPIWNVFIVPLQDLTTAVSTFAISQLAIPAFIDGYFIHLPYGIVEVAGGCSGLNYSLVAVVLALAYGHQRRLSGPMTLVAVLVLLLLSIAGNWVRVSFLILIAYYSEMNSSLVTDHGLFGWAIFCVFYLGFLVWAHRLRAHKPAASRPNHFTAPPTQYQVPASAITYLALAIVTLIILAGTPWLAQQRGQGAWEAPETWVASAGTTLITPTWQPEFTGYDLQSVVRFIHAGMTLEMGQQVYLEQVQGKELVGYGNRIAPQAQIERRETLTLNSGRTVQTVELNANGTHRLVVWTYQLGQATAVSDLGAKLQQLFEWVLGRPVTALFYVQTPCISAGCETEKTAMGENLAILDAWLDQRSLYPE
ncbi:MAG: exosortase [Saccharospirillum sp.]